MVDERGNDIREMTTITARATEYTTPASMPALLPVNSGFTWCAELAVNGAARVRFEKPVIVWVDNFLGFDVGQAAPSGYYDRDKAVWTPSENGRVVRLQDESGDGVAVAYDADDDGRPGDRPG
ncbi:MAG: hypothetical protein GY859_33970 [Desulfobacterales bacterium]|nr:hypothetical protein [Desulfobacterales bacterium]